ncbi:hypothetical protein ACH4SK_26890 [Streptomyces inhibens]|uniref:hypothetical protein n=1 Tax=Streptomyces inhibens TaxID=2293571 RepID=UPI00379E0924
MSADGRAEHSETHKLTRRGPDGIWRTDVQATDPAGSWATALEAQLAPITDTDITARTENHRGGCGLNRPRSVGRGASTGRGLRRLAVPGRGEGVG